MTKALIIQAPYYTDVAKLLHEGTTRALNKAEIDYDLITVPGALEIPMALKFSLTKNYDAYVVLGCVIRG
jgi:6,7-dimethyl-8-ribityllumazine synthase